MAKIENPHIKVSVDTSELENAQRIVSGIEAFKGGIESIGDCSSSYWTSDTNMNDNEEACENVEEQKHKTVNVLGTDYEVVFASEKEEVDLEDADGYCATFTKRILINTELSKDCKHEAKKDKEEYEKLIKRHEIVHAFFNESGQRHADGHTEAVVEFISWHFPKMLQAFEEVDAL